VTAHDPARIGDAAADLARRLPADLGPFERDVLVPVAQLSAVLAELDRRGERIRELEAAARASCTCDYAGLEGEAHKSWCVLVGGPHAECVAQIKALDAVVKDGFKAHDALRAEFEETRAERDKLREGYTTTRRIEEAQRERITAALALADELARAASDVAVPAPDPSNSDDVAEYHHAEGVATAYTFVIGRLRRALTEDPS